MSRRRVTVEQWIAEALQDSDKGAPCSALALVHMKATGGEEEIHTKQINGPQNYKSLAEFFVSKATGFCQDLPGIQTFRLLAFYGKTEPQAAIPFTASEGALTAGQEVPFSKHEPSQVGLLGLLMKHLESITAQYSGVVQAFAVQSVQRETAIQQERAEMNAIMRDVLLNMRKEDQAMRMEQLRYTRESEERAMLGRLLPSFINAATGKEIVPEEHAASEFLDGLALKVSPEHLDLLINMGVIDKGQASFFAQRIKKVREEAAKRQKALTEAPPEGDSSLNGEAKKEALVS